MITSSRLGSRMTPSETRSGSCTATSPPARASPTSSAPKGAGEPSLTAAATYRQDRREKKLPVPAEPSKTQKRGFVMPGDVALSAVSWSPTPIATRSGKAGLRGKLPSVPRSVVPRNTDRPRSRLPRGSSPPPSSTSCWRSRPRSPTRCQRPPSSQTPGPSVASSYGTSQPALSLRMRGGPDSSTPSVVLLGRTESCISPLPRRPPSTSSLTSPLDRDHRGEEAESRHGHQRPADDGEGHQGNYIYFVLT